MIEVNNLVKRYGDFEAVHGVSFTIERGRIYGFLGPNGAGKSTTMNIITGCLAATEGRVTVGGYDIYEDPVEAKRLIGYLPEQPPLYTDMTPAEYLAFVGQAKHLRGEALYREIERVLDKTGLTACADRLIKNLSKGYKQRVGIAQAILGDPEIIILDEPTVGLDPRQIIEIRDLIRELGQGHTVILSSHILTEIAEVCDYVLIIAKGQVVAADTLENLTKKYEGKNYIDLLVRGEEERIRAILTAMPGVLEVETEPKEAGQVHVRVSTARGEDIREDVFFRFAEEKMPILSMDYEEVTLEKVFLELTGEGGAHPAVSGPAPAAPVTEPAVTEPAEAETEPAENTGGIPAAPDIPEEKNPGKKGHKKPEKDGNDDYTPLFGGH